MNHNCPECNVALVAKVFDGVSFEECQECGGVWILEEALRQLELKDVEDLGRIDQMDTPTKPAPPEESTVACPACGKTMDAFHFLIDTPIRLHRCLSCNGLWIGHGELTQMAAALEDAKKPITKEEAVLAQKAELEAEFEEDHRRTMQRYQSITGICKVLSTRLPWI